MPRRPRPPEPQAALGRAVRELRKERGLTQEQLALDSGLHPTWVSQLEGGTKNPAWATVARLCEGLGVPISELARRAEQLDR